MMFPGWPNAISNRSRTTNEQARTWFFGPGLQIVVECEVVLNMTSVSTAPGLEVLEIHWRPLGGEPYPEFKGTLCAEPLYRGSCRLDLSGEYVPPGGIAGLAFDALFGHRIAEESIRDLLETFKTKMETLYAEKVRHLP
jgi:hypothetical protein